MVTLDEIYVSYFKGHTDSDSAFSLLHTEFKKLSKEKEELEERLNVLLQNTLQKDVKSIEEEKDDKTS